MITSFFWSYAYRNIIFTFADFASWGLFIAMIVIDISIIFVSLLFPYKRYQERYSPLGLHENDVNIKWDSMFNGGIIYPKKCIFNGEVLRFEIVGNQHFDNTKIYCEISEMEWLDSKECDCKMKLLPNTSMIGVKDNVQLRLLYKNNCVGIMTFIS